MARPILGTAGVVPPSQHLRTSPHADQRTAPLITGPRLQQRLRQRRSAVYLQAITRLDAGMHNSDQQGLKNLVESVSSEFPELLIEQLPIGLVGRCYLGSPYVVHVCDLSGNIVEHYEQGRAMPSAFERARALAVHPGYAFIEVYPDSLRAIAEDGSVSVINS